MNKTWITLAAILVIPVALLTACKKDEAPAGPSDPTVSSGPSATPTLTPTTTVTATSTRTPLPSATPTPSVTWCAGGANSGTVGLYWYNSTSNVGTSTTLFLPVQIGNAAVSITHLQYYSVDTDKTLRVYLYSDVGGGANPGVILASANVVDSPGSFGWYTVNIPDVYADAGTYLWLAISSDNATDDATFGTCFSCGQSGRTAAGRSISPYVTGSTIGYPPNLLANWICAP